MANPADQPVFDSRALLLGWCLWLIGVWGLLLVTIGWSPLAYRWMTFAAIIGLMGLWPAARLSQDHRGPGARTIVFVDWVCMLLVFQAVLWPMRIVATWSLEQTLMVNAAVASWSLLTGLLIAWGRSFGTAPMRTVAMLACVGLLVAEPLLLLLNAVLTGAPWSALPNLRVSPLQAVWELTAAPALYLPRPWTDYTLGIAAAALVGWCVLAITVPRKTAAAEHVVPSQAKPTVTGPGSGSGPAPESSTNFPVTERSP
ncbi:MAG: hypothetical protein AAF328_04030 [Planctomycetota bacterium]